MEFGLQVFFCGFQFYQKKSQIIFSALDGDLAKVDQMTIKDPSWIHRPDASGYSALHYAARAGHLSVCELLLRRGAPVDAVTKAGKRFISLGISIETYLGAFTYIFRTSNTSA